MLSFEVLKGNRFQNLLSLKFKILNQPSIAFLSPKVSYSCCNPNLCSVSIPWSSICFYDRFILTVLENLPSKPDYIDRSPPLCNHHSQAFSCIYIYCGPNHHSFPILIFVSSIAIYHLFLLVLAKRFAIL